MESWPLGRSNPLSSRGRLDSNPRSRCGSRLSDYADGMARRADGRWEGKGHSNTAVDISMIARFTVERSD